MDLSLSLWRQIVQPQPLILIKLEAIQFRDGKRRYFDDSATFELMVEQVAKQLQISP